MHENTPKKQRKRSVYACQTCRARKIKCDERPDGCLNCERLQLDCLQNGSIAPKRPSSSPIDSIVSIKRPRTFRSCIQCRDSKTKCSGERPICLRCQHRRTTCTYDADHVEPAWIQNIASSSRSGPNGAMVAAHASLLPQAGLTALLKADIVASCPVALTWLFAQQLPLKNNLHSLLDAYFNNVHPIRVFAFEHKPTFMRMLDEGHLNDASDQALLHIICALGARFYALDYSKSREELSKELIQAAGSQWAKVAEEIFFTDYSTISLTKLKVLVLLHDHEARTGNYAGSFLLTGLVIRMAHALQLNSELSIDVLCKEAGPNPNEVSIRESRRRLMWASYMIDVWSSSGVDHLTLLSENDLKIQLPCNERHFSLQIACVTERLEKSTVLDFLTPEDIPEKPAENLGMSAYYVRIVSIWRRVLRFLKHTKGETAPYFPQSTFSKLLDDIQTWKQSLPSWAEFSENNIYIRRESNQLGSLLLIHLMYHYVLCDLHRIVLPDLFKNHQPFIFPSDQSTFVTTLQDTCFENAQRISILVSTILPHGVRHFADSILPSFVYNSSRIMLYYIGRLLDLTKPGSATLTNRTVELVQQNNKALRAMIVMYPTAETLSVTTERWLETVRTSLASGQTNMYVAPQDPSGNEEKDTVSSSLPSIEERLRAITPATSQLSPINTMAMISLSQPGNVRDPLFAVTNATNQPMFNLNDLQNFFEWAPSTAESVQGNMIEGFGPFGWVNHSSVV